MALTRTRIQVVTMAISVASFLCGCPESTDVATVGGSVSGLTGAVVLQNNGNRTLTISEDGPFIFDATLGTSAYSITILTQPVGQVCTVTSGMGVLTSQNVSDVGIDCGALTVQGDVAGLSGTLVVQNNGVSSFNIAGSGMFSLNVTADGPAYDMTVLTQPTGEFCTMTSGSGFIIGFTNVPDVVINCIGTLKAYVANGVTNDITTFTINPVTGVLTEIDSDSAGGDTPLSIAVDPTGRFAYATSFNIASFFSVTTLGINETTGELSLLSNPGISAFDRQPKSVSVAPSGRYVIVVFDDTFEIYPADSATGGVSLSPVGSGAGNFLTHAAADSAGRFVYAVDAGSNSIRTFSFDLATGVLIPVGVSVATGVSPQSIAISPLLRFAYVANRGSNDVTAYSVDRFTGALTEVGSEVAAGDEPESIVIHPTGRFVYVANRGSNDVTSYSVDLATGELTRIGSDVSAGTQPSSIVVDPAGQFAYVTNRLSHDVTTYSIDPVTGALSEVGTPTGAGGLQPESISITPPTRRAYVPNSGDITIFTISPVSGALNDANIVAPAGMFGEPLEVDATGRVIHVVNRAADVVTTFGLDPMVGRITQIGDAEPTGFQPVSVSVDPTGRYAFVVNAFNATLNTGDVTPYTIDQSTGSLEQNGIEVEADESPVMAIVDPAARFLFVVNIQIANNTVSSLRINQASGILSQQIRNMVVGFEPRSIAADPTGRFVYVNATGNPNPPIEPDLATYTFSVDPVTGALTGVVGGFGERGGFAAVDPTGRFVYIARPSFSEVATISIDQVTGALTELGSVPVSMPGLSASDRVPLAVDPTGRFVYVVNDSGGITIFSADRLTGALLEVGSQPLVAGAASSIEIR